MQYDLMYIWKQFSIIYVAIGDSDEFTCISEASFVEITSEIALFAFMGIDWDKTSART